ncbi:hypothetical protein ACFOVU_12255 [Nocardiopsis sediminis]|uniref:Uncharacterized protein n=1 Tax=Nocardiopsis sediminis TaxID=1778267 RepID=A0ABV8FLH7_9ACTN
MLRRLTAASITASAIALVPTPAMGDICFEAARCSLISIPGSSLPVHFQDEVVEIEFLS